MTFAAACDHLELAEPVREWLRQAYGEPHRRYHDLRHLEEVLSHLDSADEEILLAALFHDAVYDPRRTDNEARSADLMRALVPTATPRAVDAILATQTHETEDPGIALLLDADLAVLARPWDRYLEYAQAIREEYHHVPDASFRPGRAAVLRSFLDRPRIYRTPAFTRKETQARENLKSELSRVSQGEGNGKRTQ